MGAAAQGDLERMGELFLESHRSMRHDYEITCDEVDFLVDAAAGIDGCLWRPHDGRRIWRLHRESGRARKRWIVFATKFARALSGTVPPRPGNFPLRAIAGRG